MMTIGERIRAIREGRGLTQPQLEARCGLLRAYISRVENGHTIPSIETLQKIARGLGVLLYQLFYEGPEPPELPHLLGRKTAEEIVSAPSRRKDGYRRRLGRLLDRMREPDTRLLVQIAKRLVQP